MRPSLLETDGYKFSMAEAGFPLRRETFYYSHRKGGWQLVPLDLVQFVKDSLPAASAADWGYLDTHGYFQGGAFRRGITLTDQVSVTALPQGAWFVDREPVFTVTGPSALVSWLEPLVLQLHYRIQVATAAALGKLPREVTFTCERERELFFLAVSDAARLGYEVRPPERVTVSPEAYHEAALQRAQELVSIVGDPDRLFEVGMRACSCTEQHRIALAAVKEAGIVRTSNVLLARELGMVPVGTMGHEHVQRHGSDPAAFHAMRDQFAGFIFYLPDTFDTLASGIPAALEAMREEPERNSGIRFDSEHGIVGHWLYAVSRAREAGLSPLLGLESGWNDVLTRKFEELRRQVEWPADRQGYGLGGYLVGPPWPTWKRDDVAAVWKISQSGVRPTMKFGDEPLGGKSSVPGLPVVWRSLQERGPVGYIAQQGEDPSDFPVPVTLLSGASSPLPAFLDRPPLTAPSPATRRLVERCVAERQANLTRVIR
jgi:nicotinate phosphoribosyltransferase